MDRRKIIKIIAAVILLVAMLIPEVRHYKDGGTVEYHAVLYQVISWHSMRGAESVYVQIFYEGLEIKILGITVYNDAAEYEARYCD
ncbi:MAG: hypothetical protein HFH11_12725 [Dorea sp.]|jgi:hypothetical protein|nr:hypothetical protein [Dorea sp.]